MNNNPYRTNREEEILSADPVELVVLLYSGLQSSVSEARRCLQTGEVTGRANAVSRAMEILGELATSLDVESGGEFAARLASLYDYMQDRLQQANFRQTEEPLIEIEPVIATLLEGWQALAARQREAFHNPFTAAVGRSAPLCVQG